MGVAKYLLGLEGEDAEGGESLLGGGGESLLGAREVAQLSLQAGQHVHFVGASGGPHGGRRIGPFDAGPLLAAMGGIWRDFALNKASEAMYGRVHRACKPRSRGGDSSVCAFFSCVACISVDARTRRVVVPVLDDVAAIFAIVLKGIAFITDVGEGLALYAGSGYIYIYIFLPKGTLRLEVEGSTSVLFAYSESISLGSDASQKKAEKLAALYAAARDKALVDLRPIIRGKVRKRPREEAQDETEARATGEQGSDLSEAQEMEAEATRGEASAFVAQEVRSSVIWPWQVAVAASGGGGRRVVHRLAVGCRGLSPSTRSRWLQSVRSWREPWLQILWVYDAEDVSLLEVQEHSHLLVRNASLVMPVAEWAEWKATAFPIPLIKDLFQLKCLHTFGGGGHGLFHATAEASPDPFGEDMDVRDGVRTAGERLPES